MLRIALVGVFATVAVAPAADPVVDFNRDIRPILSNNCYACHGPDDAARKADLRLDNFAGATGQDGGTAAVVAGDPAKSSLVERVTSKERGEVMPPPKTGKKLTEKETALLAAWVKQGGKYAKHWSYEPPVRPKVPAGATNPIDAFIRAKLAPLGLKPSPEADRYTLVRRVALDLTGLPPTWKEVEEFVNDKSANAYEKMVDRMLAKPAFGEHWARLWLDLARYADSAGYADDPARTIWAFRDYVIKSLNANKPFDRFTIEQIAGDLLPKATDDTHTATAFHRNTMTNSEGGTNDEEFRNAAVVDRVNTTMAVWMGTSMACAQCHTHKYDPITQTEYFKFFAILNNTADADRKDESPVLSIYSEPQIAQRAAYERELETLTAKLAKPAAEVLAKQAAWEKALPRTVEWRTPKPRFLSWADLEAKVNDDGSVLVTRAEKTDTYTVELPLTGDALTAIRLEALPHDSLPGKGPGLSPNGNFVLSNLSAAILPPTGGAAREGRYVRVTLPGKQKHLMLAEVQVFSGKDNVALKGKAKQSGTAFAGDARRAIDGNTNGLYYDGNSVSHTNTQDDPWWEVDLTADKAIDKLVIWNRTDFSTPQHLANFTVQLLDAKRKVVWEETVVAPPKPSRELKLNGSRAVKLVQAIADYTQPQFDAANAINNPTPKTTGWAVGGKSGAKHTLTVVPAAPVAIPAGSKLVVTLDQSFNMEKHLLGHFRIGYSTQPGAMEVARIPTNVAAALAVELAKRTKEQAATVTDYYLSVAPETKALRERQATVTKLLADLKPAVTVPVLKELTDKQRRTTKLQFRGSFQDLGPVVTEGLPAALHGLPKGAKADRLALANWLVSKDNPLTARVTVNRFWEQIFGIGLVRTSEEFGSQGEPPTHPALLDWLAVEFMSPSLVPLSPGGEGLGMRGNLPASTPWDVKRMLKLLVMSETYRQSSKVTPDLTEKDPDNRYYARGPRYRLSAETIRDQALAVSGLLSDKMYGPSVRPVRPSLGLNAAFGGNLDWKTSAGEDRHRRGLYTEWRRTSPYPSMATFDAPSREACTIRRIRTNTPLQALVTLNDPVYIEASQALARKAVDAGKTPAEKVTAMFKLALGRPPSEKELARVVKLYEDAKADFAKDKAKAAEFATKPIGPLPKDSDPVELAAWTTVANVLLNLDEMLMRR